MKIFLFQKFKKNYNSLNKMFYLKKKIINLTILFKKIKK